MKSLNSAARRGAIMTVAALSALALASCSAGQVTQTSTQAAAVDGANADTENGEIAVRDVTIHVTEDGEAGLKFTAINQDTSHTTLIITSSTPGSTNAPCQPVRASMAEESRYAPRDPAAIAEVMWMV